AEGRTLDLDVRHGAFFTRALGRPYDASKALVVVELIGASGAGGEGARLGADGPAFVFDGAHHALAGTTLVAGGAQLVIFPDVAPGTTRVSYVSPPGITCRSEAHTVVDWPVEA